MRLRKRAPYERLRSHVDHDLGCVTRERAEHGGSIAHVSVYLIAAFTGAR